MIYIKIGFEERNIEDASPQWITQTIQRAHRAGENPCVHVRFEIPGINLRLITSTCPCAPGKSINHFNRDEQRLIELWQELSLFEDPDFPPGKIVAFRQQIMRKLGIAA